VTISTTEKHTGIIRIKHFSNLENLQYVPYYLTDKGFKGTVVNWALPALHRRSFEITLTVPLRGGKENF